MPDLFILNVFCMTFRITPYDFIQDPYAVLVNCWERIFPL